MDNLKKVAAGAPLKVSASTWNAFVDAARAYRDLAASRRVQRSTHDTKPGIIWVRNDTGAPIAQMFAVLGLDGLAFDAKHLVLDEVGKPIPTLVLKGVNPDKTKHRGRFCVLTAPVDAGKIVEAYLDAVTPARLFVPSGETYNEKAAYAEIDDFAESGTDASDMESMIAMAGKPAGVTTALAAAQSLGLGAGAFNLVTATSWPTRGFWIYNLSKQDCRYVDFRSGVQVNCFAVDWAKLFFDAGTDEIFVGDLVEGATSFAKGYVDQIVLTSGSWAGDDAVGYVILKRIVGTFTDNETLQVSAASKATANGASMKGLRGFTAVAWAAADVVMPMSDVDLGLDAPSTLQFENPDPETKAPVGVAFVAAFNTATALAVGTLAAGAIMGIWRREWIEFNHQKRSGINCDTLYTWT